MFIAFAALCTGIALLIWSANRFVDGAAGAARHYGVPTRLVGIVIVGFGTSAPELVVSAQAALTGNPGLALGNAYGSNIANLGLILGATALLGPIAVQSRILRRELPLLTAATLLAGWQVFSGEVSRADAWVLLGVFVGIMAWMIREGLAAGPDALDRDYDRELAPSPADGRRQMTRTLVGLGFLILAARLLVWGAEELARGLGVSDLVIGLTIVALGTSLPELAASIVAARKGEHALAVGNIIGSNLFNTLAVVGLAAAIAPLSIGPEVFWRDILTMTALTLSLFVFARARDGRPGSIDRRDGLLLLLAYAAYTGYLAVGVLTGHS